MRPRVRGMPRAVVQGTCPGGPSPMGREKVARRTPQPKRMKRSWMNREIRALNDLL